MLRPQYGKSNEKETRDKIVAQVLNEIKTRKLLASSSPQTGKSEELAAEWGSLLR